MKPYTGQVITDNETGEGQGLKPYDGEVISPGQEPKKPGAIRKNAQDLAVSFTGSAANLLGALAQDANVITGGEFERRVVKPLEGGARAILGAQPGARGIAGLTQDANEALEQYKSPELRQAQQEQAQIEGFLPSAANVLTSPRLAANMLAEQGPILALMGRNARSASRRGQADVVARNPKASAAEILAGGQAAAQGSLVRTGAAMGGGYASNEAVQRALQLPDSVWEANPEYQALIEAGVDAQAAKERIATSSALPALLTGAGVNAAAMQLTKGLEARVFTGNAAPAGLSGLLSKEGAKAVGKAVALESAEEGITEGGEQFGSNLAVQQIDPNQDLLEGVPEGAGAGAALGGLLGGGLQVAGSALSKPAEPGREDLLPPTMEPGVSEDPNGGFVYTHPSGNTTRMTGDGALEALNKMARMARDAAPKPVDVQPGPGQTIVDPKDGPLSKAVAVAAAPDAAPAPVVVPDVAAQAQAEQDRQQAEEDQKAALKDAPAAAARTTEDATAIATGQPKKPGAREPATADEIMQALAPWNGKLMDASTQVMLARALNVPVAEVQKARAAQRQAELAAKSSGTAATATPTMPAAGSAANEEGKVIRERSDEDAAGRAGGRPDEAAQGSEGQDGQADPQGQARPVSADRKLLAALKKATSGKGADGAEYAVRAFSNGDGFYVTRKTETGSTRHQSTDAANPWSYEQAALEAAKLAGARKEGADGQDAAPNQLGEGRGTEPAVSEGAAAAAVGGVPGAQVAEGDQAPAPVRGEQAASAGRGQAEAAGPVGEAGGRAGDGQAVLPAGEVRPGSDTRGDDAAAAGRTAGAGLGAEEQADIERVVAGVRGLEADSNGLIEVRDVYGEVHRVKKADIEAGNKVLLRRYRKDGQPAKKGGSVVNIGNLDPDGSLLAAQNAESPPILITTRGGTSEETSGFKGIPALNKAIRKQGLDPADYTPRQVAPGRYVGERKPAERAPAKTMNASSWNEATPKQRRAALEAAGYTDNDQANTLSKLAWSDLTDPVRRALSGRAENATAPEHTAPETGMTVDQLKKTAKLWREQIESQAERGELVTHVFDSPKPDEIVRLEKKAGITVTKGGGRMVYNRDAGWLTIEEAKARIQEWKDNAAAQGEDSDIRSANSQKVVLSLFDLSGQWSQPWEDAGYQVYRFDIQDDWTFETDEGEVKKAGDINNLDYEFFVDMFGMFEGNDVYAILAACPCTDFAVSGARHFAAKDADGRTVSSVALVERTLQIIEFFKPAVWALENPVGRIEQLTGLPPWRLSFDPYQLGDPYTKKTLIWGRFNADLPIAPVEPTEGSMMHKKFGGRSMATKNARSETPEGFAYAFFQANNAHDNPVVAVAGKYERLDRDKIKAAIERGATPEQIGEAVDDFYYQDLNDAAANKALDYIAANGFPEDVHHTFWEQFAEDGPVLPPDEFAASRSARSRAMEQKDAALEGVVLTAEQERTLAWANDAMPGASIPRGGSVWNRLSNGKWSDGERIITTDELVQLDPLVRPQAQDLAPRGATIEGQATRAQTGKAEIRPYRRPDGSVGYEAIPVMESAPAAPAPSPAPAKTPIAPTQPAPVTYEQYIQRLEDRAHRFGREFARDEARSALASMATAREFGESMEDYLERNPQDAIKRQAYRDWLDGKAKLPEQQPKADEPKRKPEVSANKIFTEDAAEKARARLKAKLGRLNSGVDPEMMLDGITLAGYHIEKGARTFAAYTKAMVADLGDAVRPYLKSWYLAVKFDPRAAAFEAEMDDPGTVGAAQVDRRSDRETRQRLESLPEDQRDAEIQRLRDENAQLRAAADLDARTGIKNPGAYDRDIAGAGGVAAIDLTLFKGYNTLLTDAGGDAVLAAFGQAMKEVGGDAAYRRGGDEFAFLTNTPAEAQAMLDALRERAGDIELVLRGSNGALYTVSGVPFAGGVGTDEQTAVQARDANKAPGDRNALPPNVRAQDAGRGAEGGSERQDRGRPPAAEDLTLENDDEPANAGDAGASAPAEVPAEAGRGTSPDEAAGDADPQPGRGRGGRVQAGGGDGRRAARGRGIRAEGGAADAGAEGRAEVGGRRAGRKAARVPEERGADAVSADLFDNPERSPAAVPAANFRITDEVELGQGGEATKFKDNLAAIRILKELEREGRRATPAEQRALARYVGWGGLANAFRNPVTKQFKPDWEARGLELESLLTPDELKAARRSTRNAHYTSEAVVNAMWSAVERLGYRGGMALEPSSGTGNFIGLVPEHLGGATKFLGIEYDSLTARIAGALYPHSAILHTGFQKAPLPDGAFDLVIGNPPFGNESLKFQYKPELNGQSIHNQFFLGGLDALRENGIMAMVVSRYLMDAKTTEARKMMAAKAELLGAIRLPETAFKGNAGTEVVTDILFFRKFDAAEAAAAEQEIKDGGGPDWIHSDENTSLGEPFNLNRYFASNPQAILGTMSMDGKMQQGPSLTVRLEKGEDLAARLAAAVEFLPKGAAPARPDAAEQAEQRFDSMVQAMKIGLEGREAGSIRMEGDRLVQVFERETPEGDYELATRDITPATPWSRRLMQDAQGRYFELVEKLDADGNKVKDGRNNVYERKVYEREADIPATLLLGESKFERLKAMVRLRDILKRQLTLEAEDAPEAQMDENRADLNEAYDDFVKRHGLLSLPKNAALVNDMPDGALVQALETGFRPEITAAKAKTLGEKPRKASADKAAIFSRRVVPRYEPPTSADSPADALAITLSESGRVDIERIAALLGTDKAGAEKALSAGEKPLAFFDPEEQAWVPADAYLSGNVRRKLQAAKAAGLGPNIAALEAVQPERWGAESVTVHLGASWVPPKIYADFLKHLVGGEATAVYSRATNTFGIQERGADRNRSLEWGTDDYPAPRLLEAILNSRGIRVTRRTADGKSTYVDEEATALAQLKAKQMANEFADWVFMDGARREQLVELFNDKFNTRVTRQNDGSHLKLPGKVPDAIIKMRRHQNNAIWRGILDRFVLYDHAVGAGKTFTGIARAMERRRMGLSKKPMIVVPNHMVEQFTGDAYRLYPGAKILAAGREDFERSRRRKLFAKIATGDWDLIIVPHSSFGFISLSPETEARYLEREIALAEEAIREAKEQAAEEGFSGFGKPITVKEAERLLEKLENRLSNLGKKKKDRLLTFEQMGVDDLTVDEAHEFKNLFYTSRLQGVRGMGDKAGSQKAFDLYNKVRYLRETKTGSVAFMTGTPISNSAVEMFTMMRYLAADELAELGLENFDAWRAQFVEADTKMEPTESGRLKEVNRLGRTWSNMRSLMELYYSFTDAVSNEDIKRWYAEDNPGKRFPIPDVEGGDRQRVIVKPTEAQDEMLKQILADFDGLELIRDPKERNAQRLRLMDRARKLSLDIRAVDPFHPSNESGGKLEKVAEQVAAIYRETAKDKGTQLIFLDRSVPKAKGDDKIIKAWEKLEAERDRAARIGDEDAYREAIEAMESFTVSGANYRAEDIQAMRESQRGGWNAYQQIKDNLVARGIPENEIRFVQEANNDAQKQALFDAVKAGEVRILLGSTPRMGAGTNVQDRLVALHHVDVTWKPSDIEQREGRIIRQGNKLLEKYGHDNFKVRIFAYATERTVDAKMWDLNATKLKTINGIRKYDGAFTMDFNDDDAVGMAEMAALASGDPKLLERVQLQADLDKLDLLKRAHNRKMFGLKDRLHRAERTIETYPARIEQAKANRAALEAGVEAMEARFESRSVTVEGKVYTSRSEAVQAAYEAMDAQRDGKDRGPFTLNIAGEKVTTKEGIEAAIGKVMGDAQAFEATINGTTHIQRTAAGAAIALEGRQMEPGAEKRIGTMFGLPLQLERFKESLTLSLLDADGKVMFEVEGNNVPGAEFSVQYARGLITSLDGRAKPQTIASDIRFMERTLAEAREDLPKLQAQQDQPFAQAQEMADKMARLEQLTRELSGKSSPEGAASLPDGDRPTGPSEFSIGVNDLRRAMDRIVRGWKGDAPIVKYIQSATELPAAAKRGDRWFDAEGWYDGIGTIWLVADNLPNITRAEQVLAHEAFGHYGVEGVVAPGDWARIVADVAKLRSSTTLSAEVKAAMNSAERRYGTENPVQFAREFLAIMAERGIRSTLLGRVLAAVRRWARSMGFKLDRWAEQDLRELVARGMRSVERGGGTGLRRGRGSAFSDRAPVFYSALLETVQRSQGSPKRGDAAAWKGWLDGAQRRGEFRQSERNWLGVDEWLASRDTTTREELADYIRANQVQVEEVVLGTPAAADRNARQRDIMGRLEREFGITAADDGVGGVDWITVADDFPVETWPDDAAALRDEWMALQAEEVVQGGPAKYEFLQLPGGENYRELLLTLPAAMPEPMYKSGDDIRGKKAAFIDAGWSGDAVEAAAELVDRYGSLERALGGQDRLIAQGYGFTQAQRDAGGILRAIIKGQRKREDEARAKIYRSPHFDQPNILAHVRFNERTDVDGKRVLFIEEIQSDWHQDGRKKGYVSGNERSIEDIDAELSKVQRERNALIDAAAALPDSQMAEFNRMNRQIRQMADRMSELNREWDAALMAYKAVPDAPFTGTDEWAMLSFKRMARWAVDNGFDRIAWTTGDQQAERYDLSKQVSKIYWAPNDARPGRSGPLSVFPKEGPAIQLPKGAYAEAELADVIGKEAADRLLASPKNQAGVHILEGESLKIGGEGMRAFYDKILPSAVNKWAKKFGATVGKTEIVPSAMLPHNTKRQPVSVHSIDVTDAMRDAVAQGQPAFSLRDPGAVDAIGAALAAKPTEVLKNKLSDIRPALLGLLTLDQLAEISKDETPQVRRYAKQLLKMQTRRNQLQESAGRIADEWQKWQSKNRAEAEKLAGLMHDATIAGTDPAEAFQHGQFAVFTGEAGSLADGGKQVEAMLERLEGRARALKDVDQRRSALAKIRRDRKRLEAALAAEKKREDAYPGLVARFNALSDEAKGLYRTVRDEYANRSEATMVALLERVGALGIPSEKKASLSDKIRTMFESGRVSAPYFPLARFGEYWVSAKIKLDGEEETGFFMAETAAERDKLVRDLEREGWTIAARGVKLDNVKAKDGASGTFVAQVIKQLNLAGVDDAVQDEIYQLYLRTLPDLSVRKNFIHRKKVKGYANDALRAFAAHMNHGAHQLARLENGRFLEAELNDLRKAAKDAAKKDHDAADRIGRMFNEMQKRHEWVMNPRDSALVQKVSAVNFMYYLGVSPAAALVNLSQTAITTFPTLAAKYGAVRAMKETSRAMAAALRTGGNIERTAANEQERQALQALQDMGAIDKTLAHDLAGIGDTDSRDFSPMWRKTMQFVSFLFHKAEVVNREASGLATFRMAIEDGKTFQQAVDEAADIIHGTHFNYSNANRARFMQGNAAKILFAFKQYSQNMTFYLWRSFYQGVKGASPEERSFARKQLLGTLGMTAIFSGAMGMPLLSLVFGIANAMAAVFGDDDEPFDAETEFRNWLADTLGPELSRIVQLGAIQGGLTALGLPAPSISERTSLNNLWLRDPDMELEGRDLYNYWLEQVAGPVGGMFAGAFRGYSMAKEGLETGDPSFLWRGAEAALPKSVRDAMKAIRYSVQGVNTLRGDPLVEDVSVAEWIIQANGFTPSRVMEAYEVNRSVKNYEKAVMARRSALLDAYAIAHRERDTAMMRDTLDKIREFNRKHRSVAVSAETIRRSLASRRDYSERAMNGIVINRNLPQARDKGRFFDRE